jgi:hypothetical protein
MRRTLAGRKAALCGLGAAAAALSLSAGMATAQAQPARHASPRIAAGRTSVQPSTATCPAHTVCMFSGQNESGLEVDMSPVDVAGRWRTFYSEGWPGPGQPGSIINNSGSLIWFYDATPPTKGPDCIPGDEDISVELGGAFGHFYIKYNTPKCPHNSDYPTPLPS